MRTMAELADHDYYGIELRASTRGGAWPPALAPSSRRGRVAGGCRPHELTAIIMHEFKTMQLAEVSDQDHSDDSASTYRYTCVVFSLLLRLGRLAPYTV